MLNSSKFSDLLQRQKESGLSIRSFCSNECIAPSTFYYWQKKIRNKEVGGRFIPLLVRTSGPGDYSSAQQTEGSPQNGTPVEITYSNGTTLRIRQTLDLAGLRSLVSLLD